MYCSRTRFRSGHSAAVHRSAQNALQIPALLYGAVSTHTARWFLFRYKQLSLPEGNIYLFCIA